MPVAPNAAAAAIEGFLGGVEAGGDLRDRRTNRQFVVEDRLRERIAAQLTADRQAVLDQQNAEVRGEGRARSLREGAEFTQETGLAPTGTPGLPAQGPKDVPDAVGQLRGDVGAAISPQAPPAGFTRVGPSAGERESERVQGLRTSVSEFLTASPEEQSEMLRNPDVIGALEELGELGGVFDAQREGPAESNARFGRDPEGGRSITGATQEEVDIFAEENPVPVSDLTRFQASERQNIIGRFDSQVTNLREAASGFGAMQGAFREVQKGNPAAQLAMLFAYGKVLDPGSVVREGELATIQAIGAVDDRIRVAIERAKTGTMPQEMADFILSAARATLEERSVTFNDFRDAAIARGRQSGLPEGSLEEVIADPFARFFGDEDADTGGGVDVDTRLDELKAQGLTEDEAIARLRAEGLL